MTVQFLNLPVFMSSVPKKSREMKRVDSSQIYDEKKKHPRRCTFKRLPNSGKTILYNETLKIKP